MTQAAELRSLRARRASPARAASFGIKHAVLLLATVLALFPVYVMVTAAFKTQRSFLDHPWSPLASPSLDGFRTALGDQFPRWFANSAILSFGSVAITLTVAALAAWGFTRWSFPGRDTLLGLLVSLMVVPPVVLLVPLFVFGVRIGQISTFRLVILIYVGLMLPFSIYMLANFFRTIPASMIEAALVDGASSFRIFRRIVLPLSAAPLVTLAVVNLLWVWNELLIALVFLQDDTKKTLMVGITGFQSRYSLDVPAIMAGLTLATLPVVAVYVFGQRFFVRGLVAGALKGE
ncbi:MAG TPA: carbohydrate ABC transporter permease [Gaiellaceae bacterium]|nr:carbohydrate ABC transporter permease [Gaiellaceae bacterium]